MDFSDLTLDELIEAMKRTPNIAVLARMREEFRRFPTQYAMLEGIYERERNKWNAFSSRLRANFGKCLLYWTNDNIPFLQCEYSLPIKSYPPGTTDKIEWIKNAFKGRPLSDIINDTKWDALFNAMYRPTPSEQEEAEEKKRSGIIGGKLYQSIKNTLTAVPSPELDKILQKDEEELRREREIDEKLRKKEKIPEPEIKQIAKDAKETVRVIKRIRKRRPIPPEVRNLYDRYIGIKPNQNNVYKFMLWLERVMRTFPDYEYQELLDRADLGSVKKAIKEGTKPDEYYDEAYNDLVKRLHGKEEGTSLADIERADELNRSVEVFSRLLDLLFRIYSEYEREEDEGAARGILRVLCENFDICYESTIEEVRKNIQEWVVEHIDFLPE